MRKITDVEVANMFAGNYTDPEPFELEAPCGSGKWTGVGLSFRLNGKPIDPEAIKIFPYLIPTIRPSVPTTFPTIAFLEENYELATEPYERALPFIPKEDFLNRLSICRSCPLWLEDAGHPRGSCSSINCNCANNKPIWARRDKCPENKWP